MDANNYQLYSLRELDCSSPPNATRRASDKRHSTGMNNRMEIISDRHIVRNV